MGWFGKTPTGNGSDDPRDEGSPLGEAGAEPTPPPMEAARPDPAPAADVRASLAGVLARAPFPEPSPAQAPAEPLPEAASIFSESAEIEGSIEGQGDVMLRGRVRGSVNISGCLVVGQGGVVQADVTAREVVNAGTVEGNITAAEKVRVQATGLVQGDIDSPCIIIDDGGGVEGFVHMQPPGGVEDEEDAEPPPSKPAVPPAARFRSAAPAAAPAAAVPRAVGAARPADDDLVAKTEDTPPDPFAEFTAPASGAEPPRGESDGPWGLTDGAAASPHAPPLD